MSFDISKDSPSVKRWANRLYAEIMHESPFIANLKKLDHEFVGPRQPIPKTPLDLVLEKLSEEDRMIIQDAISGA